MARSEYVCIDGHTCGNPVRVVVEGRPELKGSNMSEVRQYFIENYDWIRTGLMFEPRGHDMMSGSFILPPFDPANDFAILFIETSGCLPMCGHGTIGTVTIAVQEGLIKPKKQDVLNIETPAGLIQIKYEMEGSTVKSVQFNNVKSFLAAEGLAVSCPELGMLEFDVAYGGNFYAIIDSQENFSGIHDFTAAKIIQLSQVLRDRINEAYADNFIHPEDPTINSVSHMLWTGNTIHPGSHGRNAVFYGSKAIDRSPCGTGTSARLAQLHAKGLLKKGEDYIHESYIGSTFVGRIEEETSLAGRPAIVPSIRGWARIYGYNKIIIDDEDPFAHGFQVI